MNRDYFRNKDRPKKDQKKHRTVTECCKQDITDDPGLNKNNPADWKLMEEHCERHLFQYPSVEDITPRVCDECGKLLDYICTLNDKEYTRAGWKDKA